MDEPISKSLNQKKFLALGLIVVALMLLAGIILLKNKALTTPPPTTLTKTEKKNPDKAEILVSGFKYAPTALTVSPGAKLTVINKDSAGHSVTSDDTKSFDSSVIGKHQSGTFTAPTTKGTYGYHCSKHPSMRGTLMVE